MSMRRDECVHVLGDSRPCGLPTESFTSSVPSLARPHTQAVEELVQEKEDLQRTATELETLIDNQKQVCV